MERNDPLQVLQDIHDNPRNVWPAAYAEARQQRAQQGGRHFVTEYGYAAWEQLTATQRHYALEDLFEAYFHKVYEQEQAERLGTLADADESFLRTDDVHWVQDAFGDTDPGDEDAILTGVLAGPLHRVLQELELLRFRLALAQQDGGTG